MSEPTNTVTPDHYRNVRLGDLPDGAVFRLLNVSGVFMKTGGSKLTLVECIELTGGARYDWATDEPVITLDSVTITRNK